jgi:hypothetical protein
MQRHFVLRRVRRATPCDDFPCLRLGACTNLTIINVQCNTPDLLVPNDIYRKYHGDAYAKGARVSSNSWGSPSSGYGGFSIDSDRFAHDHADFLLVFAAGNYGARGSHSLSSPGVAKNALTVGSSRSSGESFFRLGREAAVLVATPPSVAGVYHVTPGRYCPALFVFCVFCICSAFVFSACASRHAWSVLRLVLL